MRFNKPLTVTKYDEHTWKVKESFIYLREHEAIRVPEGFITDFASVPRLFWSLIPPDGSYTQAAVLHDYLCVYPDRSQKEIDLIFLEAMKVCGVKWHRRVLMYNAVHLYQRFKKGFNYSHPPE